LAWGSGGERRRKDRERDEGKRRRDGRRRISWR